MPRPGRSAELIERLGSAEEIEVSSRRRDGTLRGLVPIWIVAVDRRLYVRSHRGQDAAWFRCDAAAARSAGPAGAIRVGSEQFAASFVHADRTDHELQATVSEAYRTKYVRYGESYLPPFSRKRPLQPAATGSCSRFEPTKQETVSVGQATPDWRCDTTFVA